MIYKCLPKFENLRVFGCLCFSVKQNISDKFVERSEKCIFIGYSNEKKGYKLYNLDNSSVFFSRDVEFYEDVFPYKMKKDLINENLFSFFNDSFVNDPLPSSPYDEIVQSSYMDEVPMSETPEISHQTDGASAAFSPEVASDSSQDGMAQVSQSQEVGSGISDISEGNVFESSEPSGSSSVRRSNRESRMPLRFSDYVV